MSILIKDMEIPKNCVECKLSDHISPTECPIYSIEKGDYWDKRYKYCPIVEVPTPHGRMIDADAFVEDLTNSAYKVWNLLSPVTQQVIRRVCDDIKKYPTIIEAEWSDT